MINFGRLIKLSVMSGSIFFSEVGFCAEKNSSLFSYKCETIIESNKIDEEDLKKLIKSDIARGKFFSTISAVSSGKYTDSEFKFLEQLAQEGNNEAKYHLGWIYMNDIFLKRDDDKAFFYLKEVKGMYQNLAAILIGRIYARGSRNISANLNVTKNIFNDVSRCLEKNFMAIRSPLANEIEIGNGLRMYQDWMTLGGYRDELGIAQEVPRSLPRP